jgi:hypothetical protein
MFKIRLDAGNYIKLLGNVPNRKWHKTSISVTHEIKCTPVRCTFMRCTPVKCTFIRYIFMRCTLMRYMFIRYML